MGGHMIRTSFLCALVGVLYVGVGCEKSQEPPRRATVAKGNLMPGPTSGFDRAYVVDQKQVKLIEREVEYTPLSELRGSNSGSPRKTEGGSKKKGLFGRIKQKMVDRVAGAANLGTTTGGSAPDEGDPNLDDDDMDDDGFDDDDMDDDEFDDDDEDDDMDEDDDDMDEDDEDEAGGI